MQGGLRGGRACIFVGLTISCFIEGIFLLDFRGYSFCFSGGSSCAHVAHTSVDLSGFQAISVWFAEYGIGAVFRVRNSDG